MFAEIYFVKVQTKDFAKSAALCGVTRLYDYNDLYTIIETNRYQRRELTRNGISYSICKQELEQFAKVELLSAARSNCP